ncbi:uncharacterized protein [Rutidosis leptorrhynchoides]|uniref:uncharacterized protein isoform X2 n=1 Tax=Rutidosis leptorrhynchoides TaxID=125765 RepID=UPI003A9952BF
MLLRRFSNNNNSVERGLLLILDEHKSMERQFLFRTEFSHNKRLVTSYKGFRHETLVMHCMLQIYTMETMLLKPASVKVAGAPGDDEENILNKQELK